ncbi:hypothetical protein BASA50_003594 [Batrachochytrium salamandrivorans]|uniref:Major facilitator superfamily (MFS) profile domain-containing protein n=1 Tax=Batrachochytrium salamandrivorans TaxID=1357716 RepID=A0ABQ8FKQ5_9FUNG|nr:hypothetical protein BASA62_009925 [Batrachochytrium salamandrivorans]KAH6569852.1 hypothetical protein BASA60_008048 [Batrachochytrium salamandrivorans]KAH6598555.1 hypothetical protein BASA50_003594 [Batrachochytrium salamandrivorans]KAH6600734.1 hypothetical protein BASA61_002151 [Batrachochytrium salamandrivorans]KAH9266578.1 hypothetical protein BASA84_001066 [Batrachochytrium salamandrivorans]
MKAKAVDAFELDSSIGANQTGDKLLLELQSSSQLVTATESETLEALFDGESASKDSRPKLTIRSLVCLSGFWLGYHMFWMMQGIVLLPDQVQRIVGPDHKGSGLAVVSLTAGVVFGVASMIVGALNDRFSSQFGKRMPFITVGVVFQCLSLFLLWGSEPLWAYTIGYLIMNIFGVICSIPFNGLVADITPMDQNGPVSAALGAANLAGYLIGAGMGICVQALTEAQLYGVMTLLAVTLTSLTVFGIREPTENYKEQRHAPIQWVELFSDMVRPLYLYPDFKRVFISRLLFQLGIATIQQFLQYWIQDCVNTSLAPTSAVSIGLIPNLVLAPLAAMLIPKHHRKIVVYISAAFMITSCILVMSTNEFYWVLVLSGVFGCGFGPFISVEFAMLMDVLPNPEDAARDMSLWHLAMVLPQIVATPIAGWLLDISQEYGNSHNMHCFGYKIIYSICIVYFISGLYMTWRIQGIK